MEIREIGVINWIWRWLRRIWRD